MLRGNGVILPPTDVHLPALQPSAPVDVEWWKMGAAAGLAFLGSLVGFRTKLAMLKRDIDDERKARVAHEEKVASDIAVSIKPIVDSVARIERSLSDRHNNETAAELRNDSKTREALNAIRQDNDEHHTENRDRLRIMRQQSIAMLQLVAKIARVTTGVDPTEVDTMLGRFLMAEVERAD